MSTQKQKYIKILHADTIKIQKEKIQFIFLKILCYAQKFIRSRDQQDHFVGQILQISIENIDIDQQFFKNHFKF